jgi:hypothetical protein
MSDLKTSLIFELMTLPEYAIYAGFSVRTRGNPKELYERFCVSRNIKSVLLAEKTWNEKTLVYEENSIIYFTLHEELYYEGMESIVTKLIGNGYCDHFCPDMLSCSQVELLEIITQCETVHHQNLDLSDFRPKSNYIVHTEVRYGNGLYAYLTSDKRVLQCSVTHLNADRSKVHILYREPLTPEQVHRHFEVFCLERDAEPQNEINIQSTTEYPLNDPDGFNFEKDFRFKENRYCGQSYMMACARCNSGSWYY